MEVCFNTQGATENEKSKLELQMIHNKSMQEMLMKRKKEQKKFKERINKELEKRTEAYDKAIAEVPNGWASIGMAFVENLAAIATNPMSLVTNAATHSYLSYKNAMASVVQQEKIKPTYSHNDVDLLRMFCHLPDLITNLVEQMEENGEKNMNTSFFKAIIVHVELEVSINMNKASKDLQGFVKKFVADLNYLVEKQKNNWLSYDIAEARKEWAGIQNQVAVYASLYKKATDQPSLPPQTPFISQAAQQNRSSNNQTQMAMENAHMKVTQATEMLKSVQDSYDRASEKLIDTNDKLNEAMTRLAQIDSSKMTVNEILKVLQEGLKILGLLKERWGMMTLFFEEMVNIIQVSMNKPMQKVLEYADSVSKGASEKVMRDLIYTNVRQALAYAHVVNK